MARGMVGFAQGEADAEPAPPTEAWGSGNVLDLDEGTVVSLVDRRREEVDEMGTGDAAGRPDGDKPATVQSKTNAYRRIRQSWSQ